MVEHQHEPAAFASRRVLYVGAALLVSLSLIGVTMSAVFRQPHSAQRNAVVSDSLPQPRLQDEPARDLEAYETDKRALLTNYAWLDRKQGTVRMPIDRAMGIIAQRRAQTSGAAQP